MHRAARLTVVLALASVVIGSATAASLPGVRTPSGNIKCAATPAALHCDIVQASYRARLQARCIAPPSGLDWHGFELTPTGKGAVTCSGGILVMGPVRYVTLAYGRTWHYGAYTCRSRVTGLTCTNRAGHGLFLSRLSYRVF